MSESKDYKYSDIGDDEEQVIFIGNDMFKQTGRRVEPHYRSKVAWLSYATLSVSSLLIGGIIGYNVSRMSLSSPTSLTTADTSRFNLYKGVRFESSERRFNGSLFKMSEFSGPPTPEIDDAWDRYTEAGSRSMPGYPPILNISTDDAIASTGYSLETAVRLNETQNVGYMAGVEFFHQMHCLNMIRKFLYIDYYKEKTPDWYNSPLLPQHADHCVDIIRQNIMCHGDTNLVVFHWVNGYSDPVPDFSVKHTCRNPEALLSWMKTNQMTLKDAVYKHGEKDLPEIF